MPPANPPSTPPSGPTSFYDEHCSYLPAMAGWFFFSSVLSIYNKKIFGKDEEAFPYPLFMTSVHFLLQWIFSTSACALVPSLGGSRVWSMNWKEWALISIPCGMVTSADVGLSNVSMVSLSLTLYTLAKASTPIFVLGWAYVFGIERITWPLVGVVIVIVFGEVLTVTGHDKDEDDSTGFELKGFLICLTASLMSGARWTLVQLKIQKLDPPLKSTIATMRLLAPTMFFSLFVFSIAYERPWVKLAQDSNIMRSLGLGAFGGCVAICMILCELYLIMHASAIILMIGGVTKEIFTIFLGVVVFNDNLTPRRMLACLVIFSGVAMYKIVFHLEKKKRAEARYHAVETEPLSVDAGESLEMDETTTEVVSARDRSNAELRRTPSRHNDSASSASSTSSDGLTA